MQSNKKQLCRVPETVEFEFYPEQQLHTFIEIQNLTDEIVTFKIKTTAPAEYLVKPMEGQIYKKQKNKIVLKRKKLSLENFEAIQNGTKPFKEKFMFVITCKSKNAIGIQKLDQQNQIVNVKFITPRKAPVEASPTKKTKKVRNLESSRQKTELINLLNTEKSKLQALRNQRASEETKLDGLLKGRLSYTSENQEKPSLTNFQLSQQNLIYLVVLFLLLGLFL